MKSPARIVSLISSATEILYLLELDDRVVGVSHECDYPPRIASKPRLTRSLVESAASSREIDDQVRALSQEQSALYAIDVPLLTKLSPDLVITQAQCDVCAVRYEDVVSAVSGSPELAQTNILALNPQRIADILADITRIGEAAGVAELAARRVGELSERIQNVRDCAARIPPEQRPRVALLEWIDPPMLAANWTPELVVWAGGNDGLAADGRHSSYADWNALLEFDPQVIVLLPCGFDVERAIVEAQVLPSKPGWNSLSAVRVGRVFAADGNAYFNRSGPRLVESLEILAHLFHPELFAPPLPASQQAQPQQAWIRLQTRGDSLEPESI